MLEREKRQTDTTDRINEEKTDESVNYNSTTDIAM